MKRIKTKFINYKLCMFSGISFLFGFMIAVNLYPIEKTCRIKDTDREYNIMNNGKLRNPDLIVMILSAPKNLEKRHILRKTWLTFDIPQPQNIDVSQKFIYKHYFVIGSLGLNIDERLHLSSEQSKYNDILLLPLYDSYKNLTYKILQSFVWLHEQTNFGLDFKYVLKCDDDTFVRIDVLSAELRHLELIYIKSKQTVDNLNNKKSPYITINMQMNTLNGSNDLENPSLYWGYFSGNARIHTKGKWKEDSYILCDFYLPYARGGGYILSKKLIQYLAANAEHLRLYNSEDVSIGTWLSPVSNILRIHDTRFDTEYKSRGCQEYHIITHNLNNTQMQQYFNNLQTVGRLCAKEFYTRSKYLYNWLSTPSKCCKAGDNFILKDN